MAELPDLDDSPPSRWPDFWYRLPAVANSANRAALRDGTSYPSEVLTAVRINPHTGVRVPCKQAACPIRPTCHHLDSVLHHNMIIHSALSSPLFLKILCPHRYAQHDSTSRTSATDDWASPKHFHLSRSPIRDEIQGSLEGRVTRVGCPRTTYASQKRRSALSASERLSDSTEPDLPPPRQCVQSEVVPCCFGRPQTRSTTSQTPNSDGGRELAAAVARHPREILAGVPQGAAQIFTDP